VSDPTSGQQLRVEILAQLIREANEDDLRLLMNGFNQQWHDAMIAHLKAAEHIATPHAFVAIWLYLSNGATGLVGEITFLAQLMAFKTYLTGLSTNLGPERCAWWITCLLPQGCWYPRGNWSSWGNVLAPPTSRFFQLLAKVKEFLRARGGTHLCSADQVLMMNRCCNTSRYLKAGSLHCC